jgi:hypothetical protein
LIAGCIEDKFDYTGDDIATTSAESALDCQMQCEKNPKCQFWTWGKPSGSDVKKCFLKDHIKERKENDDTTSGTKDCSSNKNICFFRPAATF